MAFQAARRWIKDHQFVRDEYITRHPQRVAKQIQRNLDAIPLGQRAEAVKYAKAYANLYYVGRHNQEIPRMVATMNRLESRQAMLDVIDTARETVRKFGTPEQAFARFTNGLQRGHRSHFELAPAQAQSRSKSKVTEQAQSAGIGIGA